MSWDTVRSGSLSSALELEAGNATPDADCGGDRRLEKFFGRGGTGGT